MQQIQLTDSLYRDAQRRAAAAGFASVDEYVAQVVSEDLVEVTNDDHLFTPERLAHLDHVSAAIDAGGKTHTAEQVAEHFERKRRAWPKKDTG